MNFWQILLNTFLPIVIILFAFITGLILRGAIFSKLMKLAEKTETKADDIIVQELRAPFILWSLLVGLYFAAQCSYLSKEWLEIVDKAIVILAVASVTVFLAKLSISLLNLPSSRLKKYIPSSTITNSLAKIFIYSFGILIILNTLGISITPLLTAFGLGGLAVALALQDTLSNLFSGFYITVSKQVRVGDYIKLESDEKGYVEDIGWRATRVKMLQNNVVLIPNAKLAQSIITNYYFPSQDLAVLIQVGVHYESDLEQVEKVTIEVGREVMKEAKGGVPEFTPFIRYHTFDNFSINFTVILRAKEFVDNYLVKHEFIKRLHKRYREEGITIPYPIAALNYSQEKAK